MTDKQQNKAGNLSSAEITPREPIGEVQQAELRKSGASTPIPLPVDDLSNAELKPRSPLGEIQQAERPRD